MSPCCAHRMHALFWNPKIRARTHPDPPGCSNFTFVNKLQTTHKKMHMMCVQINAAGRNHWKFNKRRAIMIYVARQNLISPVHVDLNCGKTVSRAPPDRIFFSPLPSVLGVFWQYGATESIKNERLLTLLDISNTADDWSAYVKS